MRNTAVIINVMEPLNGVTASKKDFFSCEESTNAKRNMILMEPIIQS